MTARHRNKLTVHTFFKGRRLPLFFAPLLALFLSLVACGPPTTTPVQPTEEQEKKPDKLSPKEQCVQENKKNRCEVMGQRCGTKIKKEDTYCYKGSAKYSMECVYWDFTNNKGIEANDGNDAESDEYLDQGYCIAPCTQIGDECGLVIDRPDRPAAPKEFVTKIFDNPPLRLFCEVDNNTVDAEVQKGHCVQKLSNP